MTTTSILAGLLVVAFAALGSAKLAAVPAMRAKAEHVGFSVAAYRRIGFLEVLAVLGLIVGAFVPVIGALAAAGLLMLLGGRSSRTCATATASARSPRPSCWVW